MLEITKVNFTENYSKIIDDLQSSLFTAIDCEFSGLAKPCISLFDSPEDRYKKLRDGLTSYSIIQVGLSTFHRGKEANHFSVKSYCFYLLPTAFIESESKVTHEINSIKFLSGNGFDFNKLFYNGLSYLGENDEARLIKMINEETLFHDTVLLEYIQSVCSRVCQWAVSANLGNETEIMIDDSYEDYMIYIIHQEIRKRFHDIWTLYDTSKTIKLKKVTPAEKSKLLSDNKEKLILKKKILDSILGFSRIIKELKHLKKPIVGHNVLIDLMMIYKQFFDHLPKSYKQFKKNINNLFPEIYDTKHCSYQLRNILSKENAWNSNALSELYAYFKKGKGTTLVMHMPFIEHQDANYAAAEKFHEGAFDSYCAGYCFVKMAYMFSVWDSNKKVFSDSHALMNINWLFHSVSFLRNRINLARATIKYIVLDGPDPSLTRPPMLCIESVQGRPLDFSRVLMEVSKYTASDIKPLSKYKGLIVVQSQNQIRRILEECKHNKEFRISKYNYWKHSLSTKALGTGTLIVLLILVGVAKFVRRGHFASK